MTKYSNQRPRHDSELQSG